MGGAACRLVGHFGPPGLILGLWIDFGPELGVRQSSAQITEVYTVDKLIGKQIGAVVNFPPKRIASFKSEVLVLGVSNASGVVLISPDEPVLEGGRVH